MRRNDYDVSDSIRTTDSAAVGAAVARLVHGLYPGASGRPIERAFADAVCLYHGTPAFTPATPATTTLQHVLDVTLAQARLRAPPSSRPGEVQ